MNRKEASAVLTSNVPSSTDSTNSVATLSTGVEEATSFERIPSAPPRDRDANRKSEVDANEIRTNDLAEALSPTARSRDAATDLALSRRAISRSVLTWLILVLGCGYAATMLISFPKWTVDDAYITYRYASNLAHHGELTWNVGEDPVEGYTGVFLPVVLAGAMKAGLDADATSKLIGVLAFFAGGGLVFLLARRLGAMDAIAALASVFYFVAPIMFTHAVSGLETTLFSTLVLLDLVLLTSCLQASCAESRAQIALPMVLLVTCLTRPEGIVLAALALVALVFATCRERPSSLSRLLRLIMLFFLVPASLYFLWRLHYYGLIFPNTYYAKARSTFQDKSLRSLGQFAAAYLAIPFTVVFALLLPQAWSRLRELRWDSRLLRKPDMLALGVGTAFALVVLAQYMFSALRMNYSFRFFVPLFAIFLVLAAVLTSRLSASLGSMVTARHVRVGLACVLAGVSFLQVFLSYRWLPNEVALAQAQDSLLGNEHIPAGSFLKEVVPTKEWLAVVIDAGAVPYFSGLRTIDFGGINDELLSRRRSQKVSKKAQRDYVFAHDPGAIVVTSYSLDRLNNKRFMHLFEDDRFGQYRLVRTFGQPISTKYNQFVFLRSDIAESQGLANLDEIWKPGYDGEPVTALTLP